MGKAIEKKLQNFLQNTETTSISVPFIFDLTLVEHQEIFLEAISSRKINHIVDDYETQLKELFQVLNPKLVFASDFETQFKNYLSKIKEKNLFWQHGRWVYYPWISTVVHTLEDESFQLVRTARNKNLIRANEQEKFYNSTIGIAGLSVGSNVAFAIVLQGGGRHLKLADFDTLSLSNMNRIRTGIDNLGLLKVEMVARQIYLLNPYTEIEVFSEGLTEKNIELFFDGLDIIIDEIDNLGLKYLIRQSAKKYKTPVVMGADNGDNAVIDIERYDLDPQLIFFHNRIGKTSYEELLALDKLAIGKKIIQHIGIENITERVQESMLEIGKSIVSWPQLGGAALLNGSAVAYCVRKILTGELLEKNRSLISMDEKLIPNYLDVEQIEKRKNTLAFFRKSFKL